jgi:cytochrome c556
MKSTAFTVSAAVAGLLVLGACKPAEPAADKAAAAPITAPLSINELMVMIVDVPGERLWDVEKAGHKPATDEQWYHLESHAVELIGAGTLIRLGGTGPKDADWVKDPAWQASAEQMIAAAQHARTAAKAKNFDDLVTANGEIVDACEACHKVFKPDIPTGRLFLHPSYQEPKAGA